MTKKISQNSGLYYREPEKHAMGPLSLATLQVAMHAGSLSHSAEVSQDGDDPWVPLAVVLEDPSKAFVHYSHTGVNEEVSRSATESKGISPPVIVGILSFAMVLGIIVVNLNVNSKNDHGSDVTLSSLDEVDVIAVDDKTDQDKVTEKQLIDAAYHCFIYTKFAISHNESIEVAEANLSKEQSAGESQLQAIKLQKLYAENDQKIKAYKDALEELVSLEEKAGVTNHYSIPLKDFYDYGSSLAREKGRILKYKSFLDPEYSEVNDKLFNLCWIIKLEKVLAGGYKAQSDNSRR
jgi:hypothetical protein